MSKYVKDKGFNSADDYIDLIIRAERAENGRTVSREHAECELVAHFTTDVLFRRATEGHDVFDEFYSSLNKDHPEQARGFFAAIKNFLRKIRDLVTGHRYDSQFADLERRFSKMVAEAEQKYGSGSDVNTDISADTQQKTAAEDTAGGERNYIDLGDLPSQSGSEYNNPITIDDVKTLRSIGRKSINEFTQEDIKKAQKWAYKFYQQLGEKSPFFRAWFGDWRAYDVSAANVVKFAYGETPKLNYKKREVYCEELKTKIVVDETVINDSKSYAKKNGDEKQITKLLGKIDEILSNGILFDTQISAHSSGNKKGSTQFMHYLYTPISVNGAPFIAKLSVEEYDLSGKTRAYNLQRIELSEVSRAQYSQLTEENRGKYAYTSDALSVAQLFDFVKQKDKNFNPKHVDKHLVNEDGTPKKFYHGTSEKFTAFNPDEFNPREGSFFFAENREDAAAYGNNIFEVYLTGNKFADYDNQPSEFYRLRDKREQVEYLKERGYDGWYADMDSGGWGEVSVFSPTQIKSATDNIGTFDESNPDIRYFLSLDDYVDDDSYERVLKRKNNALQEETEGQIAAIHKMFLNGDITESEILAAENDVMENLFEKVNKQTHNYVRILRDRNNQRAAAKKTRSEVKGEIRNEMSETERKKRRPCHADRKTSPCQYARSEQWYSLR